MLPLTLITRVPRWNGPVWRVAMAPVQQISGRRPQGAAHRHQQHGHRSGWRAR
jgi:hypothetical protein